MYSGVEGVRVLVGDSFLAADFWLGVGAAVVTIVGAIASLNNWRAKHAAVRWQVRSQDLAGQAMNDVLKVTSAGKALAKPALTTLHLHNERKSDIPSSAFDGGRAITLQVSAPVVALVEPEQNPHARLPVVVDGDTLRIGPGHIRSGEPLRFVMLTDGLGDGIPEFPLIDIPIFSEDLVDRHHWYDFLLGGHVLMRRPPE